MIKTYKTRLLLVTLIIILLLYFFNTEYIINNFLDYTKLFYTKLFPSCFIFFVFSSLLIEYKILDLLPINITSLYVFLLSLISGFPSGSKYTKELLDKNYINLDEAKNLLLFSHFPNPLFILGPISTIINNKSITIKLLISIIISNLIIFLFSNKKKSKINKYSSIDSFSNILNKSINKTLKTILLIYGTSIFFYLISSIITKYIYFNNYLYVLISFIFDLTKGCFSTIIINNNIIKSIFILLFMSFGSISIHIQVMSILNNNILYKSFIKGRFISTILSFIIFISLWSI